MKSNIEQIVDVSTTAIKKRVQTQFGWTSESNGAKLRMTKNKSRLYMCNNLMRQILDLEKQSMSDLRSTYEKLYYEKPSTSSRSQLIRQITYRLQELEYGFLSERYMKKLDSLVNEMAKGKQFGEVSYCKPINGTRICKEYHGTKYEIESVEGGFVCGGLFYKSLSSLASKITGHKTNGLKFFGVRK